MFEEGSPISDLSLSTATLPPLPVYTCICQMGYYQVLITQPVLFTRSNTTFHVKIHSLFCLSFLQCKKKKRGGEGQIKSRAYFCHLLGVSTKPNGSIFGIPQINLRKMVRLKGRHMYPFCQLITDSPYEGRYSLLYRTPGMQVLQLMLKDIKSSNGPYL